jgi:hypothetical protein
LVVSGTSRAGSRRRWALTITVSSRGPEVAADAGSAAGAGGASWARVAPQAHINAADVANASTVGWQPADDGAAARLLGFAGQGRARREALEASMSVLKQKEYSFFLG